MNNLSVSDDLTWGQNEIDDLWQNINRSPSDPVSYWISIASFIFAILGSISNLMSVIVLLRLSTQLATFIYLTALSLSDMITCISIGMTHILEFIIQSLRNTSIIIFLRYIEIIFGSLAAGSRVLSLWISTAVTMDRWILICYPIYGKTFCTLNRARNVSRILFLIGFLYSVPLFFEYEIIQMPSFYQMIHFDNHSLIDENAQQTSMLVTKGYSDLAKRRLYRWAYMFFNAIFVYTVPTITIVIFNLQLIRALHRVKSRAKRMKEKNPLNRPNHYRSQQSKYSVTIMVIIMVLTLLIFRSPTIVLWVLWSFEMTIKIFFDSSKSSAIRRFHNIANLIAIINAATNFLPFCVFGQLFRAECLNIYCCRKPNNEQITQTIRRNYEESSKKLNTNVVIEQPIAIKNGNFKNILPEHSETTSSLNHSSAVYLPCHLTTTGQQHLKTVSASTPLLKETINL
jgi:hypothetical protein